MKLLPVVDVTVSSTGESFRLFDNCLTMAAVDAKPGWQATKPFDCEDCCPSCEEPAAPFVGDPGSDGAWWSDNSTSGALGLLVNSVELEPVTSARRFGDETQNRPEFTPRELVITGQVLATSYQSTYALRSKLVALFNGWACEELELGVRPFCPSGDPGEPLVVYEPGDREPVNVDCWGGCPPGDPLAVEVAQAVPVDSGRRRLMRARFVSFDEDDDVEAPLEDCYGLDWVARFEVWAAADWGDLLGPLCSARPVGPDSVTDPTDGCRPHRWGRCRQTFTVETCEVGPGLSSTAGLEQPRTAQYQPVNYCQPMFARLSSCLIPSAPAGNVVAPVVMVSTGSGEVTNLRVEIVEAVDGWPAPDTCEGEELYAGRSLAGLAMIAGPVPARSVLTIDGRSQRVVVDCPTGSSSNDAGIVEGYDWPTLDPNRRWWVTVVVDCLGSPSDVEFQVYYAPRFMS